MSEAFTIWFTGLSGAGKSTIGQGVGKVLRSHGASELFEKAQRGEIKHVAGVDTPYEEPLKPEVLLNTDQLSVPQAISQTITTLEVLGHIEHVESACYTAQEEETIRNRLEDLGYL
jgi:adenylylsulfate kinase-like enzyme